MTYFFDFTNWYIRPNPYSNAIVTINGPTYRISLISLTTKIPITIAKYLLSLFKSFVTIKLPIIYEVNNVDKYNDIAYNANVISDSGKSMPVTSAIKAAIGIIIKTINPVKAIFMVLSILNFVAFNFSINFGIM